MKHLLTLLLLLGSTVTFAQNEDYRLFRDGVQYLYAVYPGYINFGIKLNGTCDSTYTYLANAYECATYYPSYFVEPAFAGYEVCQEVDATSMLMKDDRLVTLYPRAGVGQNWMSTIEDTSAIWAVVDSIRLDTILGQADSIKYISFHEIATDHPTLNTIRIGKTLGLVGAVHFWELLSCPETFILTGVSEPIVGLQYLPAAEFLAPDPSLEIHFEEKYYGAGQFIDRSDSSYFQYHQYKLELEDWTVAPSGDSLTYIYRGSKLSYRIDLFGDRTPYDSILRDDHLLVSTISRAEFAALSQQPGTMSSIFSEGKQQAEGFDDGVTVFSVSERTCFGQRRSFGTYYELRLSEDFAQHYSDGYLGNVYYAGIGMPFHRTGSFDVTRIRKLLYRKDENGECGTPYDFSGIIATPVSTNTLPLDHTIKLFPNPASNSATLRLPSGGTYEVSLMDLHGRKLVDFQRTSGDLVLNVDNFSAGVYVVSVARGGKLMGRRRLVVR